MMNQNLPAEPSATNGTPALERSAPPTGKTRQESFLERAMDALSAPPDNDAEPPVEKPKPQREAPERQDADEPDEEPLSADSEEDEQDEPGEAAQEEEAHAERGSKEDPFSVKDLPADKFIELKVDGEKMVVGLDELAKGYIREQTFSRRVNKTKLLADEAQAAVAKAHETQERLRSEFQSFVHDDEQVFEFFTKTKERQAVLERAAMKYAQLLRRWRENPAEQLAWERQRDEAHLRAKQEAWEAQRRQEDEARQQAELRKQAEAIWNPGWSEGLRRAGFPEATTELRREVMLRCRAQAESGEPVTSDDIARYVTLAAKLLELPPRGAKKPKAAPQPPPRTQPQRGNGRDPWKDVPAHKKTKSVDFWLSKTKPRDWRI